MSPDSSHGSSSDDRTGEVVRRYPFPPALAWDRPTIPLGNPERLRDLFRGCLVWGAVGDALGRPAESRDPAQLKARFGPEGLREYVPWHGWRSGPKGTFTDDTQLTMATAESLLGTGGTLDPNDLARRFLAIAHIRGIGHATARAIEALRSGIPWWEAGQADNSAGNGAAMRAAPVGLMNALASSPEGLVRDAVLSAVPTHPPPVGVAAAVTVAAGVAWCVRARLAGAVSFDLAEFINFVCATVSQMEPGPTNERKPGGRAVKLVDRVRELPDLLSWPTSDEVFAYTYNGAFALESVPAALYAFLHSPDDPRQVILTAVNAGYDADTVASMAGNLAGAWCGSAALQPDASWWTDLEDRGVLLGLADELLNLAMKKAVGSTDPSLQPHSTPNVDRRSLANFAGCLLLDTHNLTAKFGKPDA